MRYISVEVYCELLKGALLYEPNRDKLFQKLLCTIIHLTVAAEQLEMTDVAEELEILYQIAAKYSAPLADKN